MKVRTFTDPFTACDFLAVQIDDTLTITNAMTDEKMTFKIEDEAICVPLSLFEHVETLDVKETCDILEISRQRLSQLVNANTLHPIYIGSSQHFVYEEVLNYKKRRKTGRPKKE